MNAKTLKALKGAVRKWEKIEKGLIHDLGEGNCPLCKLFIRRDCRGCPVNAITGERCMDTPYGLYREHLRSSDACKIPDAPPCDMCKLLARIERNFLQALLPERQR